jgi:chemotaxis protein CheX
MSETAGVATPAFTQSAVTQAKIAAAIVAATQEVFSVMLGLEIQAAEARMGQIAQDHTGVVAVLGLTGEWAGTGQVACDTAALACQIAGRLLMAEYDEVGEDVLDAIAEVANMVVGNVKNALEDALGPMALSTPSVIFGGSFETRVTAAAESVVIPFECCGSQMTVQIVIAPHGKRR